MVRMVHSRTRRVSPSSHICSHRGLWAGAAAAMTAELKWREPHPLVGGVHWQTSELGKNGGQRAAQCSTADACSLAAALTIYSKEAVNLQASIHTYYRI